MMFSISPLLALIALVTIPLTVVITVVIAKRSQKLFVAQWTHTGELNAQIEESYTGHALVKVFGRQREVEDALRREERRALPGELRRPVHLRHHHAGDDVRREPRLRGHRGGRRPAGGHRRDHASATCRRSSSTRASSPSRSAQLGSMANLLQSGVASAERVFELLDADEQSPDPVRRRESPGDRRRPSRVRERLVQLRPREAAHRGPLARRPSRARPSRSSARPARARPRWST